MIEMLRPSVHEMATDVVVRKELRDLSELHTQMLSAEHRAQYCKCLQCKKHSPAATHSYFAEVDRLEHGDDHEEQRLMDAAIARLYAKEGGDQKLLHE